MYQLCLIRHGETEANRDGITQGHCDYPLTENGVQGAEKTGIALRHVNWTHIYTSDLTRASRVS
jgi:2,3-bisphosphoglycerate-dependent phosphoglycerate mutase